MARVTVQEVLTQEQVNQYVRNGGVGCPFCGGSPDWSDDPHVEDGSIYQQMHCGRCGGSWTSVAWIVGLAVDEGDWQYATGVEAGPTDYRALAEKLAGAMKGLFEHCAMIHSQWGENCNRREASMAEAAAHAALDDYRAAVLPPDSHPGWDRLAKAVEGGAA